MCLQGQEDMGLYTTVFGSTMVSETHCQIDKSVYTHPFSSTVFKGASMVFSLAPSCFMVPVRQ